MLSNVYEPVLEYVHCVYFYFYNGHITDIYLVGSFYMIIESPVV